MNHPQMKLPGGAEMVFSIGIKDLQENADVVITENMPSSPNEYELD